MPLIGPACIDCGRGDRPVSAVRGSAAVGLAFICDSCRAKSWARGYSAELAGESDRLQLWKVRNPEAPPEPPILEADDPRLTCHRHGLKVEQDPRTREVPAMCPECRKRYRRKFGSPGYGVPA